MKYEQFFLLALFTSIISSCAVNEYIAPPFTNVDKILELKPQLTVEEVTDILKIEPHDMVHSYETGSMILIYNYRVKDLKRRYPARSAKQIVHSEESQRDGEQWYSNNYRELFLLFSDSKLKSVFSERSFSEGGYIEMVDKSLITPSLNGTIGSVSEADYSFLSNIVYNRSSIKEDAKIAEDEKVKKRNQRIAYVGLGLLSLLGIFR